MPDYTGQTEDMYCLTACRSHGLAVCEDDGLMELEDVNDYKMGGWHHGPSKWGHGQGQGQGKD